MYKNVSTLPVSFTDSYTKDDKVVNFKDFSRTLTEFKDFSRRLVTFNTFSRLYMFEP